MSKPARSTGLILVSVIVVLAGVAGCGAGGSDSVSTVVVDPVRWVVGQRYSSPYALQVVEAPKVGAVVVDTAAEVSGVRRVQARWNDGSGVRVATDDDRPALITPWAWVGEDRVFVAGDVCADPPVDYVDQDNNDFADLLDVDHATACGSHPWSFVIRVLDLTDGTWSELNTKIPGSYTFNVSVAGWGPTSALFGGAAEDGGNERVLYRVDLVTGARATLDGPAEGLSVCPSGGVHLAFATGALAVDGQLAAGRFSVVTDAGVRPLGDDGGEVGVKLGCADDAMVLWAPEDNVVTLARYSKGTVARVPAALPFKNGIRHVSQRNLGGHLAVWEDRGTSFQLWTLHDGAWVRGGTTAKGLDPPSVLAVVAGVVVTGNERNLVLGIRD